MDSVVNSSYILVYVHTLVGAESDVAEFCLKQLFTVTDNRSVNFHQLYTCVQFLRIIIVTVFKLWANVVLTEF